MEFIFRNAAGLHLQRLLRNKYLLFPVTCTNAEIQTILTYGLDLIDQKFEDHT